MSQRAVVAEQPLHVASALLAHFDEQNGPRLHERARGAAHHVELASLDVDLHDRRPQAVLRDRVVERHGLDLQRLAFGEASAFEARERRIF